jgi:hypothetical protein
VNIILPSAVIVSLTFTLWDSQSPTISGNTGCDSSEGWIIMSKSSFSPDDSMATLKPFCSSRTELKIEM